jgi:tetratricopeptide (TPR) repeat protein
MLAGLLGLTGWNFTRSNALGEAQDAEGRGQFATALWKALDHLDRRPWSHEADRIAARCLSRLDFAEAAEPYYRWARTLTVEDLQYRAYGLVRANQRERAIKACKEILDRRPADVTALRLEAGVLLSQSRWDEAKAVARLLVEAPPGPVAGYAPIAVAGHWSLEPIQVASARAIGYTLEAIVNHDVGEPEAAVAAFERVLEVDPLLRSAPLQPSLFWSQFAEDLLSAGRSADAIRYLTQETAARNDAGLMDLLGQAYLREGSVDEAQRCWRQSLAWDPNDHTAWLNLGRIELQRDRPQEAIRLLTQAVKLKPSSYEAAYSLTLVYRRLGQEDEARHYEEKAQRLRQPGKNEHRGMGYTPPRAAQ